MKTKTRNLIGNILVWGGLILASVVDYGLYVNKAIFANPPMMLTIAIISLLIGGLWGMRK